MGDNIFHNISIPLLWGSRAIFEDANGKISIVEISKEPKIEILNNEPAPNIKFSPLIEGYKIFQDGELAYIFEPRGKIFKSINLGLPDCQIFPDGIRIGSSKFFGNNIGNFGVGISINQKGISMGDPLPAELKGFAI